jgi:hypothetical protein
MTDELRDLRVGGRFGVDDGADACVPTERHVPTGRHCFWCEGLLPDGRNLAVVDAASEAEKKARPKRFTSRRTRRSR